MSKNIKMKSQMVRTILSNSSLTELKKRAERLLNCNTADETTKNRYEPKPVASEDAMAAIMSKKVIIQQSRPLHRTESDLDKIKREFARLL